MVDGNISMEEDTELRDLVVQTLENNGVLAKVRVSWAGDELIIMRFYKSLISSIYMYIKLSDF